MSTDKELTPEELRLADALGEGVAMQVSVIRDWVAAMTALGLPRSMIRLMLQDVRDHLDAMIDGQP